MILMYPQSITQLDPKSYESTNRQSTITPQTTNQLNQTGFLIDIDQPINFTFYFMDNHEIEQRSEYTLNTTISFECRTVAGQEIIDTLKLHPNRIFNIDKADLLIFELGDDDETNWPHYGHPQDAYINGPPCDRKRYRLFLNEFYRSQFVNDEILGAHPRIQRVLFMDIMNNIYPPTNSDMFIGFGPSAGSSTSGLWISFPPPLQPNALRHQKTFVENDDNSYFMVFQGSCRRSSFFTFFEGVRHRLARLMKDIEDKDIVFNCKGYGTESRGQQRDIGSMAMYDLISNSKFALDLPGDELWAYRFAEIIHLETVIIRIDNPGDRWTIPFQHVIDWNQIAVIHDYSMLQDEPTWKAEIERLRDIPDAEYQGMRRRMKNVQDCCLQTMEMKIHCLLLDIQVTYLN